MADEDEQDRRTVIHDAMLHRNDELHTSPRVKELAAKGARHPETLTDDETVELCGYVVRHIELQEQRRDPVAE